MKSDEKVDLGPVKKHFASLMKGRWKVTPGGYKFDRWLFKSVMFVILAWLLWLAWSFDFELDYFVCEEGTVDFGGGVALCENPFFHAPSWKNTQFLSPGAYGTDPALWKDKVFWVPILSLGFVFLLNHFLNNQWRK